MIFNEEFNIKMNTLIEEFQENLLQEIDDLRNSINLKKYLEDTYRGFSSDLDMCIICMTVNHRCCSTTVTEKISQCTECLQGGDIFMIISIKEQCSFKKAVDIVKKYKSKK
jgi:hypothetical protein